MYVFFEIKYYRIFDTRYSVSESRATVDEDGSGPEFHINFGSGHVQLCCNVKAPTTELSSGPCMAQPCLHIEPNGSLTG